MFLCVSCYACKMFQAIQQKKSSTKFACERPGLQCAASQLEI
eukprot:COSAG03_NODE_23362_length_280_cov_1.430939_1_plen_41_part_10